MTSAGDISRKADAIGTQSLDMAVTQRTAPAERPTQNNRFRGVFVPIQAERGCNDAFSVSRLLTSFGARFGAKQAEGAASAQEVANDGADTPRIATA